MAKGCCGGSSGTCGCQIIGQGQIDVSGSGGPSDPFILDVDLDFTSSQNKTFTTQMTGDGSTATPYSPVVTFTSTAQLDDIPDVLAPAPTNGQVLAWSTAQNAWVPQAATVAPAGAVLHDTSMTGDGSAGSPLAVLVHPDRLLGSFPAGLGLSDQGMSEVVQHFVDATARAAAVTAPFLNQMTMLDTNPGIIWYWTGTVWSVQPNQTGWEAATAMLELSGPWNDNLQPTVMVIQVATTTDSFGAFDVLGTTELAGRSGVLTAMFSEQGSFPWKVMLNPVSNKIVGTAYRVDDGSVMAGTPITGSLTAIVY
jgi:hypothetical protein